MNKFVGPLLLTSLTLACSEPAPSDTPIDPYSVRVTAISEDGYGIEGVTMSGGLYAPILEASVDSCDSSTVLHLAPWFRLNLSTGRSTLWSTDAPALVVLPWYEDGIIRAETVQVNDATLDADGVSISLVDAEFCLDGPSDSLFVLRETSDNCDPIGEFTVLVESLGDWSTPMVCNEATVRGDYESCYVDSRSVRVDCP